MQYKDRFQKNQGSKSDQSGSLQNQLNPEEGFIPFEGESCRDLAEYCYDTIRVRLTPAMDTSVVVDRLERLLDRMDSKDRLRFSDKILKEALNRTAAEPELSSVEQLLGYFETALACDCLLTSLETLLHFLPESVSIVSIGEDIQTIEKSQSENANEILSVQVPNLIEHYNGDIGSTFLSTVVEICSSNSTTAVRSLQMLSVFPASLSAETGHMLRLSKVTFDGDFSEANFSIFTDCLKHLFALFEGESLCTDSPTLSDVNRYETFAESYSSLWKKWGFTEAQSTAEMLYRVFQYSTCPNEGLTAAERILASLQVIETVMPHGSSSVLQGIWSEIGNIDWYEVASIVQEIATLQYYPNQHSLTLYTETLSSAIVNGSFSKVSCELKKASTEFGIERLCAALPLFGEVLVELCSRDNASEGDNQKKQFLFPDNPRELLESLAIEPNFGTYDSRAILMLAFLVSDESTFNNWRISGQEFLDRLTKFQNVESQEPFFEREILAIGIADRDFRPQVRAGNKLDLNLINKWVRKFTLYDDIALQSDDLYRVLVDNFSKQLSELPPYVLRTNSSEVFSLLTWASKNCEPKRFDWLTKASFPWLAHEALSPLARLNTTLSEPQECFDFLENLRLFIDDGLVIVLEDHEMERKYIDRIKELAGLDRILKELQKFKPQALGATQTQEVWLVNVKGAQSLFIDQFLESCIIEEASTDTERSARLAQMQEDYLQGLLLYAPRSHAVIGGWYTLVSPVHGKTGLTLAGGGLRGEYMKRIDPAQVIFELKKALQRSAAKKDLTGPFLALGERGSDGKYLDEGRVAQHPSLQRELISHDAPLIRLPETEWNDFPLGYGKGPIKYLISIHNESYQVFIDQHE